jgi:glycosyltransferase involved in cell wall biosynthesis
MRLLIVVPDQDRVTGNWITAARLRQGLTARGHSVTLAATSGDDAVLRGVATAAWPDVVLLLHAWRSGRPWLETGCATPFAVLLTGTDINAGLGDAEQAPVIATVLHRAAAILSQNPLTVAALQRDLPDLAAKIGYLPPGIVLGNQAYRLRERLGAAPRELLLLCPAGIRPVKGVRELIDLCVPLIREGAPLRLAFCGPILDEAYGRNFLAAIAAHPWASYLGTIPPEALPAAMRQADVIVNNSISEGLPNALVEAAALGRPIVARAIPGNRAVVTDGGNGLLFDNAVGFRTAIRRLLEEPALRAALSHPDPERFSAERETAALEALCRRILTGPACCDPTAIYHPR